MKTVAPILASTPDNEELASSRDTVLATCGDESCAYFHQGHYTDAIDPTFMHRFMGISDPAFRLAIERYSAADRWELYADVRDGELTPEQARRLASALIDHATVTESLNAERDADHEASC